MYLFDISYCFSLIYCSSIVENKNFHKQAEDGDVPYLYSLLSVSSNTVINLK